MFKLSVLNKLVQFDCSMSCSQVVNGENGLQIWIVAVNIFSKKLQIVLEPNGIEGAYMHMALASDRLLCTQ